MKKVLQWLDLHAEGTVIGLLVAAMAILMFIQCILRYVFHTGINWVEEVVVYFHVWCGFIGISYCVRHDNDMRIDLSSVLPPKVARILKVVSDLLLMAFYVYMLITGVGVVQQLKRTGQASPAASIPMYYVYGAFAVGAALALLRYVQRVVLWIKKMTRKGAVAQ